ncbi:MAG: hypothetical protein K9M57_01210 [Phycisphaerae bacterium]|nr:hypothetical protein [Phycisphaerae bacterium]
MMKKTFTDKKLLSLTTLVFMASCIAVMTSPAMSFKSMSKKGPWELLVQLGEKGNPLRFPVEVSQDDKPLDLHKNIPIFGSTAKIKIQQYLPDLRWETYVEEQKNSGAAARVSITGSSLPQPFSMLLSTEDLKRKTRELQAGKIGLLKLVDPVHYQENIKLLSNTDILGMLTVRINNPTTKDKTSVQEFIISPNQKITLPGNGSHITILDYVPHFTIDIKSKKVTSASDEPINPAIKVKIQEGDKSREKWIFANYPDLMMGNHPGNNAEKNTLQVNFDHFSLKKDHSTYYLIISPGQTPALLSKVEKKIKVEAIKKDEKYPLDGDFVFTIDQTYESAALMKKWTNGSEKMNNPALIVQYTIGGAQEEVVLELGKPFHKKTDQGTMILMYRKVAEENGKSAKPAMGGKKMP